MKADYLRTHTTSFGERLKILIANHKNEGRKCTQENFANKIGISLSTLKQYMKNETKPDFEIFLTMAKILGVDPYYLASKEDTPFRIPSRNDLYSLLCDLGYETFPNPNNENQVLIKKNDLEIYIDNFSELETKVDEFLQFQMYIYKK